MGGSSKKVSIPFRVLVRFLLLVMEKQELAEIAGFNPFQGFGEVSTTDVYDAAVCPTLSFQSLSGFW